MNRTFRGAGWHAWALLAILLVAGGGCKRSRRVQVQKTDEGSAAGAAVGTLQMGDPRAAAQLVGGFHAVENGAWRWTERRFAATLHPPVGAAQKGAFLALKVTVPPVVIEKEKDVTLAAAIAGAQLGPEKYTAAGEYTYRREVPAQALAGDPVRVDFTLDKAMPPGGGDQRELGIIVLAVGLESK